MFSLSKNAQTKGLSTATSVCKTVLPSWSVALRCLTNYSKKSESFQAFLKHYNITNSMTETMTLTAFFLTCLYLPSFQIYIRVDFLVGRGEKETALKEI